MNRKSVNQKEKISVGDFRWEEICDLPKEWTRGAFHGNGVLGSMVYFTERNGQWYVHVELGCNNVYDRRASRDFWMAKQFDNPRLPIGYLEYPVKILNRENLENVRFEMHTDIYKGWTTLSIRKDEENSFEVDNAEGMVGIENIVCRFYVCAEHPMIVIEQEQGEVTQWKFFSREAISPRQTFGLEMDEPFRTDSDYRKNSLPKVYSEVKADGSKEVLCVQDLDAGYRTVTICQMDRNESAVFISIDQEQNLQSKAVRNVLNEAKNGAYKEKHQKWWTRYYNISSLEIPDEKLQAFYWRQMYKLGSTLHRESRVLDNQGPWLSTTPWPGTWWNLNVQLCYWPLYTSGRLEQAESLNRYLMKYQDDLIENVPLEYRHDSSGIGTNTTWNLKSKIANPLKDNGKQFVELGNLTWALQDCWLYYRMTMDKKMLHDFLYPLLRRSINYYLHFIEKKADGKLHLPFTDSPEYGELCEDCNYDLSLLRWGCQTLLESAEILEIKDEKQSKWQEILDCLAEYPVDETGYMIGKDLPYAKTHRHFSHLMMHVPLYLVNRENSDSWELLERSIKHWFSYEGDIMGFSYVGASLMYSAYQKGDEAVEYIKQLLKRHITENSMYREAGPVMETPLAAAECIQQLVLQSWGGKIRVFPAMPKKWEKASFHGFTAQGGFRVAAEYNEGKTNRIEIESRAGEPCVIETDMEDIEIQYLDGRTERKYIERYCELDLKKGESAVLLNMA